MPINVWDYLREYDELRDEILAAVDRVFRSGRLILGQEGIKFERDGDLQAAMTAYLAAGESGNGMAQKRLGDIYNTGNAAVRRDYETALKWYQKARAQGVEIPKPITNPGGTRP